MINDYLQGINNATAGQTADVNTATQDLSTLQAGAGNLPQKLKDALNTKLNNNKDIINQQSETMSNYFNSGAEARQKYQNIWDPFEKAKLVEQQKSMALQPYDVLSGVLENRMGTVNDIVQSGIGGWQGMTNAATTKLQAAQSNLANALQAYQLASTQQSAADTEARLQAQNAESARQFNLTNTQAQEQQKISNKSIITIGKNHYLYDPVTGKKVLIGTEPPTVVNTDKYYPAPSITNVTNTNGNLQSTPGGTWVSSGDWEVQR
jgi:hypothetical protein